MSYFQFVFDSIVVTKLISWCWYCFVLVTTIKPNIGTLEYKDFRKITMADLPGLIEGAHANLGMGHKFLRHIERTKLVLMIVDVSGFQLSSQHKRRSALDTIMLLNKVQDILYINEDELKIM